MTADTAVTLMLEHDIMTNPLIPVDACPAIATALERMWQVGFDHASKKIMTRHTTPVRLVSLDGKTLATYGSIEEAAKDTGYGYEGIKSALKRHSRTKSGHYFEYVQEAEVKELQRYAEVG